MFSAFVLSKYEAHFEMCELCGFLRVRNPSWLEEAYSEPIAQADTGLVKRNIATARRLSTILYWVLDERGKARCLDFAGGYGLLTRLMRDNGFNFYWTDRYSSNLLASGFEYEPGTGTCRIVTAMEVLEHLANPSDLVEQAFEIYGADYLVFSTALYKDRPPLPDKWWYYALSTGQHISFFRKSSLIALAAKHGLYCLSVGDLHLFSRKPVNSTMYRLALGPILSRLLSFLANRGLSSRTMQDHEMITRRPKL